MNIGEELKKYRSVHNLSQHKMALKLGLKTQQTYAYYENQKSFDADTVLSYNEIVKIYGVNKNELFSRSRKWFDNSFKDYKAVININDKESGELSGKGIMHFDILWQYMGKNYLPIDVEFYTTIKVKDGKYRYEFTNFKVIYFWTAKRKFSPFTSAMDPSPEIVDQWYNDLGYYRRKKIR